MKGSELASASPTTESLPPLESQHALLRTRGARLEEVLDALCRHPRIRTGSSDAEWLHAKLDEFRRVLCSHFEWEEKCGLFEGVIARAPRLANRASTLLTEHQELRADLDRLLEDTLEGAAETEIRDRFYALRKRLVYHDYAESSLLQRAFLDDLGDGD